MSDDNKKSALAHFRDEYFESEEGQSLLDTSILKRLDHTQYLRNRLEQAFLAGARTSAMMSDMDEDSINEALADVRMKTVSDFIDTIKTGHSSFIDKKFEEFFGV